MSSGDNDRIGAPTLSDLEGAWRDGLLERLPIRARALFSSGRFVAVEDGVAVVGLPNEPHLHVCEGLFSEVETALASWFGVAIPVRLIVDGSSTREEPEPPEPAPPATPPRPEQREDIRLPETPVVERLERLFEEDFLGAEARLNASEDSHLVSAAELSESRMRFVRRWADQHLDEQLDAEQAAAVAATDGNVRVMARAGAGKTRTLVTRALFLQKHCGVSPREILLLAFNTKAVEEIKERLSLHVGREMPHVMTFHALAIALVQPQERLLVDDRARDQRSLSREIAALESVQAGPLSRTPSMGAVIKRLGSSPSVVARMVQLLISPFMADWERLESGELDLAAEDEAALRSHQQRDVKLLGDRTSLDGTYVKSIGELLISNALFLNDITAEYEAAFDWDGAVYRPDFTIRTGEDTGVIIEYFGLLGDPEYFGQARSKRRYWRKKPGWELVEFRPRDIASRGQVDFTVFLLGALEAQGVSWRPLDDDEIRARLPREISATRYTEPLKNFVTRCRGDEISHTELQNLISNHSPASGEEELFLELVDELYAAYLEEVIGEGYEDFNGILWRAVKKILGGETNFIRDQGREVGDVQRLRFVLIDEFQDFTKAFHALTKATQAVNPVARLFCVGDDWQSINGFAGSDLRLFHKFEELFDEPVTYEVTTNYRSAATIVRTANALMSGLASSGPRGVPATDRPGRVSVWRLDHFQAAAVEEMRHGGDSLTPAVLRLVNFQLVNGRKPVLLSRTNHVPHGGGELNEFLNQIRAFIPREKRGLVSASTTHRYKGLESDAVIVVDALDHRYPLIHPHWKFQRVFGDTKTQIEAEERRLFYVALTRATDSLDLITGEEDEHSPFLDAIVTQVEWDSWDEVPPVPSVDDAPVQVRVRNGYAVRELLRSDGFGWFQQEPQQGENKYWHKTIPPEEDSDYSVLDTKPWNQPGVHVQVLSESGELLYESGGS